MRRQIRTFVTALLSLLVVSAWLSERGWAATISVNSFNQEQPFVTNGNCTLGEAVQAANTNSAVDGCTAGSGGDVIRLPAGTYSLTQPTAAASYTALPNVSSEITITPLALSPTTTIEASGPFRIFRVMSAGSLIVANITLIGGEAATGGSLMNSGQLFLFNAVVKTATASGNGGAIYNQGWLQIDSSTLQDNSAGGNGGAVYSTSAGTLISSASTFTLNNSVMGGGAVFNNGTLQVTYTTFSDNQASGANGDGGALYADSGSQEIVQSRFTSNTAVSDGGAVVVPQGASLTVDKSVFDGNTAVAEGGAIKVRGSLTVTSSTFANNQASLISGYGGAVRVSGDAEVTLNNVTLSGNQAAYGGGIAQLTGVISLQNSLLDSNLAATSGPDCYGIVASGGYNLIGISDGCAFEAWTGDLIGSSASPVTALLGPFVTDAVNPTMNYFPIPQNSPAVNAADLSTCAPFDQLFNSRVGGDCDMGAIENTCGDTILQGSEECDDGNAIDGDTCDSNCTYTGCGNGIVTAGEACDDGNTASGDGCSNICQMEVVLCGDGLVQGMEACDDGNTTEGDGCDSNCTATACGNGIQTEGEQCDDGNLLNTDSCDSLCRPTICGNGILQEFVGEECDDGNVQDNDGCSPSCHFEICGDGIMQSNLGEQCDDGNTTDEDGCDMFCRMEIPAVSPPPGDEAPAPILEAPASLPSLPPDEGGVPSSPPEEVGDAPGSSPEEDFPGPAGEPGGGGCSLVRR